MMLAALIVMFILATADIAVSWNLVLAHTQWLYRGDSTTLFRAVHPKFLLHLVNNVIADVLLILRCFVVWGKRKSIIYASGLLLVAGTVLGILSEGTLLPSLEFLVGPYIVSVLALNIVVTLLTAGRILWIAREVKRVMGRGMVSHYHFAVGILVESGLIYTMSAVLVFILSTTNFIIMAAAISIRVVCIMPILLIVQIALGHNTKDVHTTVSMLQAGTQQVVVLDTIVSGGHVDFERGQETHDEYKSEDVEDGRQPADTGPSSRRSR
ncbi:hypothetical protein GALMADRAFT_243060 [Galerina marginata CBS 339.88]|uniref:Uncharacterized protein n=1 Tax=Galerina marginata (strain CBS 339.88) TaxID=685588 RepID=A0A067T9X1_GALM3|nr:hypothetical protein GALMADRAFT_243060 [Galerina marginata CBS 339.88]